MTDSIHNHPTAGIIAALEAEAMRAERIECAEAGMPASDHPVVQRAARVLDAAHARNTVTAAHLAIMTALEHLTADDLPARLVRDIQTRTLRAAALAAIREEGSIPWYLEDLADNIESEADADTLFPMDGAAS